MVEKTLDLILAMSEDQFMAIDQSDEMLWTGNLDKKLFKHLTCLYNKRTLGVSYKTSNSMPKTLKNRTIIPLSTDANLGISLLEFAEKYPGSWLIGGPTIALKALELNLINLAFITEIPVKLDRGIDAKEILLKLEDNFGIHILTEINDSNSSLKLHIFG